MFETFDRKLFLMRIVFHLVNAGAKVRDLHNKNYFIYEKSLTKNSVRSVLQRLIVVMGGRVVCQRCQRYTNGTNGVYARSYRQSPPAKQEKYNHLFSLTFSCFFFFLFASAVAAYSFHFSRTFTFFLVFSRICSTSDGVFVRLRPTR